MIALVVCTLFGHWGPDSGDGLLGHWGTDSVEPPIHLSTIVSAQPMRVVNTQLWMEMGLQLEILDAAVLRYSIATPLSIVDEMRGKQMAQGYDAPDLVREMHTICAATQWRWGTRWVDVGAGWSWARFDTLLSYEDPRDVYVENQDGLQISTTDRGGWFGPSADHVNWLWKQRIARTSPCLMAEVGGGWEHLSFGLRAEYRFSPNIGLLVRFRFP